MLRNYVVIALRNLLRDKVVTSINIVGLSVAIAVSAILGIGVHGMLTADWNLREDDRLFRVVTREISAAGHVQRPAWQREDLAAALAETFPEIDRTTRVIKTSILMTVGERHLEHEVVEVDPPFLQMFHYPLAAGNPASVLDGLDQVVISKRLAERMFGDEFRDYPALIGQQIVLHGNEGPEAYTISGVFADLPKKRSLDFDAAIRFENRTKYGMVSYWGATASTYIALQPLAERKALEAKLPEFSRAFIAPVWERYKGVRWQDDPNAFQLELQDARTIYLDSQAQTYYDYENSVDIESILALVALIGVILTVACLNFTTLAVAGSIGRSAEVGVRKALGANKAQIALQFLGEGVLLAFFSLIAGLALLQLGLPAFNAYYGLDAWSGLVLGDLGLPIIVGGGVLLVVLIGIAAGSYPALIAASMQPSSVVRGSRRKATSALLTLQYGMAVLLIFCTIAIRQQLTYVQSRDLGHAADQVVVVKLRGADPTRLGERFKEATLSQPGVAGVALLQREFPTSISTNYLRRPDGERIVVHHFGVDPDFFTTLGIGLVSGRSFAAGRLADRTESVVVNQSLADAFGWGENAVGEFLPEYGNFGVSKTPTVIGIAPDFHFRSFREPIKSALFHYGPEASFERALVRLNTREVDDTLAGLEQIWEKVAPEQPFEYEFLDQTFARQYESDEEISRTVTLASVVAILIACMGLFGHATIVLQRRTKEIGVRKVLGATVAEILTLLSRDVTKMVALACLLAFPLAHFLVGQWLSQYAYQFGLGLTTYLLCGTIAFAIALGTVAYIGIRAARENPVNALRYE